MPTNAAEFAGLFYATAYHLFGGRVIVLGTCRSDRAGVRSWLARTGFPRSGAYLTPAAASLPGFFVKPYLTDAYYRVDPETLATTWDDTTEFGDPITVTERDGFRG